MYYCMPFIIYDFPSHYFSRSSSDFYCHSSETCLRQFLIILPRIIYTLYFLDPTSDVVVTSSATSEVFLNIYYLFLFAEYSCSLYIDSFSAPLGSRLVRTRSGLASCDIVVTGNLSTIRVVDVPGSSAVCMSGKQRIWESGKVLKSVLIL